MINVWVGNLAQYNAGKLIGEWIELPCLDLDEKIAEILGQDEEAAVMDYENDFGLKIKEHDNIHDLNELAEKLDNLDEWEMDDLKVILEEVSYIDEALDILEKGEYMIRYEIESEEDLGYALVEDTGILADMPAHLHCYFDYEKYGRDCTFEGWTIHHEHSAAILITR